MTNDKRFILTIQERLEPYEKQKKRTVRRQNHSVRLRPDLRDALAHQVYVPYLVFVMSSSTNGQCI